MGVQVIIDTDVIVDYLKRKPESYAKDLFKAVKAGRVVPYMTSITLFELIRGAKLSPEPKRSMNIIKTLQATIKVLDFNEEAAEAAAEICVQLERRGKPLEIRDIFIAAIAKAKDLTLTTRNIRRFERVGGIKVITPQNLLENISIYDLNGENIKKL